MAECVPLYVFQLNISLNWMYSSTECIPQQNMFLIRKCSLTENVPQQNMFFIRMYSSTERIPQLNVFLNWIYFSTEYVSEQNNGVSWTRNISMLHMEMWKLIVLNTMYIWGVWLSLWNDLIMKLSTIHLIYDWII